MWFEPTEDQAALRAAVRRFARNELAPGYLARAKSEAFPWDLHRRVASLGTFGLLAGPEHNPLPTEDFVAAGLAVEELAYADFNIANAAIPVMLMSSLIARHGGPGCGTGGCGRWSTVTATWRWGSPGPAPGPMSPPSGPRRCAMVTATC